MYYQLSWGLAKNNAKWKLQIEKQKASLIDINRATVDWWINGYRIRTLGREGKGKDRFNGEGRGGGGNFTLYLAVASVLSRLDTAGSWGCPKHPGTITPSVSLGEEEEEEEEEEDLTLYLAVANVLSRLDAAESWGCPKHPGTITPSVSLKTNKILLAFKPFQVAPQYRSNYRQSKFNNHEKDQFMR